tara:strand:- start:109342 stop:110388 length:1047 start_codon:yes stop_codon:yes gene_type:complete
MNSADERWLEAPDGIASYWCLRFAEGPVPADECAEFEAWISDHPDNRDSYDRLSQTWDLMTEIGNAPELGDIRANALEAMQKADKGRRKIGSLAVRRIAAVAACLLLVVTAAFYLLANRPDVYRTGIGEKRIVQLADGSRLSLDASSEVDVAFNDTRRSLKLVSGRAKFDVAKDPRRPFIVSAQGKLVVATGTSFSVELVQSKVRIILYEGNVAVLEAGPDTLPPRHIKLGKKNVAADQFLVPGSVMVASSGQSDAKIMREDLDSSVSWETGQLTFSDEPLSLAVARVNRYSTTKIVLHGKFVQELPISGVFNAGDPEGFADGVSSLYPVKLTRTGDDIFISAEGADN